MPVSTTPSASRPSSAPADGEHRINRRQAATWRALPVEPDDQPSGLDINRQMCVAGRDHNAIGEQSKTLFRDHRFAACGIAELAGEHRHEWCRQMLGHEDRRADFASEGREEFECMDSAGRRADASRRTGPSAHPRGSVNDQSARARRRERVAIRGSSSRVTGQARGVSEQDFGEAAIEATGAGLGQGIGCAHRERRRRLLRRLLRQGWRQSGRVAPRAASIMPGIDLRPPAPGISRSSMTTSTRTCDSALMASSPVPATPTISNSRLASIIRDRTARATVESSTTIRRMGRWRGGGAACLFVACAILNAGRLRRRRRAGA